MSDVLPRLRARVHRRIKSADRDAREQAAARADRYSRALGLHLTPDEQLAMFKEGTQGAPLVRRPQRRAG